MCLMRCLTVFHTDLNGLHLDMCDVATDKKGKPNPEAASKVNLIPHLQLEWGNMQSNVISRFENVVKLSSW